MRISILTIFIFLAASVAAAQPAMTETRPEPWSLANSTASVVWERYKVADRNVSFIFPKMPVRHVVPSMCGELKAVTYLAYAEGVIYEVVIAGPRRSVTQVNCGGKIVSHSPRKLEERLAELREDARLKEDMVEVKGASVAHFASDRSSRWMFPNPDTPSKWIEIAIAHYPNAKKPDVSRVVESLLLSAADGIEIGKGADVTLGDAGVTSSSAAGSMYLGRTTSPATMYWQPKVYYIPPPGMPKFEGTVDMNIEFLANGSIGRITPEKKLQPALLEAITTAIRKITFLPKRANGLPVNFDQDFKFTF